ncbi:hypothetical protein A9Q84_04385 [Halobacteriovorax marinus]|uniref:Lipoprotein n=1 Tax=Halobacteriovorax marinus TaxID=97084 RepID=A0A1Y5FAM2_9BACT|nr:hypothetical protein A9Q84_04385 [Halobacteriovorax marinus]
MKWILCLILTLLSTTIQAETYTISGKDPLCKKSNTGELALKVKKGNENIFQIGVRVNAACEIQEKSFFRLYWYVDIGSRSYCEGLTSFEKKYFQFEYNQIERTSSKSIRWKTGVAKSIIKKAKKNGYKISPWIDIVIEGAGKTCIPKSYITVNGQLMELDEMKLKLRFLKVKSASAYLQDQFLTKFF